MNNFTTGEKSVVTLLLTHPGQISFTAAAAFCNLIKTVLVNASMGLKTGNFSLLTSGKNWKRNPGNKTAKATQISS